MGRTLLPFRMALEDEFATWSQFKNGLSDDDKLIFSQLIHYARHHADSGSLAARPMLTEVIFMGIAIEQQKSLDLMYQKIASLSKQLDFLTKEQN